MPRLVKCLPNASASASALIIFVSWFFSGDAGNTAAKESIADCSPEKSSSIMSSIKFKLCFARAAKGLQLQEA